MSRLAALATGEVHPQEIAVVEATDAGAVDEKLVAMWVHGRSNHTVRAYRRDVARLREFTRKPLRLITLGDLQAFSDSLTGEASSRGRTLASVKSILTFAFKLGAVPFNVGAALRKPPARDGLADRILTEADVARMLALTEGRDHALIRLAYNGGFRVSELVSLQWKDIVDGNDGSIFVTVLGKGGKTRTVRISRATASFVRSLHGSADSTGFVFAGRKVGKKSKDPNRKVSGLTSAQAWNIVRSAAKKAGIEKAVSPHFMRHAHASHAIERGVKVTTVRDTLGHSSIAVTDRYAHARPGESSGDVLAV
jgi:site-specific recombinase XerD